MSEYTPIDSNIAFSSNTSDKGKHVCRTREWMCWPEREPCCSVKQYTIAEDTVVMAAQNQVINSNDIIMD